MFHNSFVTAPTYIKRNIKGLATKADFPEVPASDNKKEKSSGDPRIDDLGRAIEDDFAQIRDNYATPKNAIVLAHGLMGFDQLRLAGQILPGIQYWRGITQALEANGCEVIIARVPASGSIEERALKLGQDIAAKANGKSVNIIAHSMGGLDSRYMISQLQPENVKVLSLTTVATPHRGSAFADYCFDTIGPKHLPYLYKLVNATGLGTGAFEQLRRKYMAENFNPKTPDDPTVRYFSYGAVARPGWFSAFRLPHKVMDKLEGPNDGLVSVASSKWGTYKGTLVDCSHLDLINWTSRIRWYLWRLTGHERR